MDHSIVPIEVIKREARAALHQVSPTNPYPPFTPAHDLWDEALRQVRAEASE